ncbi:MAG: hypothetical protein HYU64_01520 [Armatimonadetes bacterium]|nr:hypothetical protein [Armatimonadota bacterium]
MQTGGVGLVKTTLPSGKMRAAAEAAGIPDSSGLTEASDLTSTTHFSLRAGIGRIGGAFAEKPFNAITSTAAGLGASALLLGVAIHLVGFPLGAALAAVPSLMGGVFAAEIAWHCCD